MNGKECKGLIDTGCSRTVVSPKINVKPEAIVAHSRGEILSFDGQAVPHDGEADVAIEMAGRKVIVRAIMCARVLEGTDVIVCMDVLSQYVVTINRGQLNVAAVATSSEEHRIVEKGFEVVFNREGVDCALAVDSRAAGDEEDICVPCPEGAEGTLQ